MSLAVDESSEISVDLFRSRLDVGSSQSTSTYFQSGAFKGRRNRLRSLSRYARSRRNNAYRPRANLEYFFATHEIEILADKHFFGHQISSFPQRFELTIN